MRQRYFLDMGPVRAGSIDRQPSDALRRAMAQGTDPREVQPIVSNEVGSAQEAAAINAGQLTLATASNGDSILSAPGVKAQTETVIPKMGSADPVRGGARKQV